MLRVNQKAGAVTLGFQVGCGPRSHQAARL